MPTKQCFACKADFPAKAFNAKSRKPSSSRARCAECRASRRHLYPRTVRPQADQYTCVMCRQIKAALEFGLDRSRGDSRARNCRACVSLKSHVWAGAQPPTAIAQASLSRHLRATFGITLAEFESMAVAQGGTCACCGRLPPGGRRLYVDHCHTTGRVRGLLCSQCNSGIGMLGDTVEGLERAIAYLRASTPKV